MKEVETQSGIVIVHKIVGKQFIKVEKMGVSVVVVRLGGFLQFGREVRVAWGICEDVPPHKMEAPMFITDARKRAISQASCIIHSRISSKRKEGC